MSNSRLLSMSPPTLDGDFSEMTIQELQSSAAPPKPKPRFSLFAPSQPTRRRAPDARAHEEEDNEGEEIYEEEEEENTRRMSDLSYSEMHDEYSFNNEATPKPLSKQNRADSAQRFGSHSQSKSRPSSPPLTEEERLRRQLFAMQKINAAFEQYASALNKVREREVHLAEQVQTTKGLLNHYVTILSQSEHTSRLLLDPTFHGATADYEEQAERRRRDEQARIEAQLQQERKIEEARLQRELDAKLEAERRDQAERAATRGSARGRSASTVRSIRPPSIPVRGVRGLRAPTASAGLSTRTPSVTTSRGRGGPTPPSAGAEGVSGRGIRPPSATGVRGLRGTGIPRGRGTTTKGP